MVGQAVVKELNKKITRTIIFNQILKIDPTFLGGRDDPKIFKKLKSWFYGRFTKRAKLSKRVISSAGQKLPKDWEEKWQSIVASTSNVQMPKQQRADGTYQPGVKDDDLGNTDQVPVRVEEVSNGQWGRREDHDRLFQVWPKGMSCLHPLFLSFQIQI